MNRYIVLIILAFITFLNSCSSILTADKVIGKYKWDRIYGVESTIELKEDFSFKYEWQEGLAFGTTKGHYRISKNKIILTSEYPNPNGYHPKVLMESKSGGEEFTLIVLDHFGQPAYGHTWAIKNDSNQFTKGKLDINGRTSIKKEKGKDSLIVLTSGSEPIRIKIDSNLSYIKLQALEPKEFYHFFNDVSWTYRKGRIYNPEIKKDGIVKKNYYSKEK